MTPYRCLVTGSRELKDRVAVYGALDATLWAAKEAGYDTFIVVHGACPRGADLFAEEWTFAPVSQSGITIISEPHPADWERYGKSAGFRRNYEMVQFGANCCLAFYQEGAGNRGTSHCAWCAERVRIPVTRYHLT